METKPDHLGHIERLRERFVKAPHGLLDYELIELLLAHVRKGQNVKPAAKDLLKRFGSIAGVLDANKKELEGVPGIKDKSAILIMLVKKLLEAYAGDKIKKRDVLSSPNAVVDFAKIRLAGLPHEAFMVIYLNVKNHVLAHEVLQQGTVDRAIVYPRQIIKSAIDHHAASLILSHNHPSGDPEPSQEDKHLTRSVIEAARTVEIRVLDHIIVGKSGYFSFQENRLLG
jgi:DNA repair protein RadC